MVAGWRSGRCDSLRLAVQWSIRHPQGKQVATVIPLQRRRLQKGTADKHSAEAFWRNSMVPASIAMGIIIVAAVATLGVGVKTGWLGHDSSRWVLVAALVSVIGLTKIVLANMVFFLLMQDDARLDPPPAPPDSSCLPCFHSAGIHHRAVARGTAGLMTGGLVTGGGCQARGRRLASQRPSPARRRAGGCRHRPDQTKASSSQIKNEGS